VADLKVEAPSADLARALMQRLGAFPSEVSEEGGACRVSVALVGDPDRALVQVLDTIDDWMVDHELGEVRVMLEQRAYTLTQPPRAPSASTG
jgi:hypothetical protein